MPLARAMLSGMNKLSAGQSAGAVFVISLFIGSTFDRVAL